MGGAGGHMRHPHDLDEVQSGKDIIALFRAIPAYLRSEEFKSGQTTSLKLDGSNNAIKVVEDGDGGIQFAVDRGGRGTTPITKLDVQGVTLDRLQDRFPKNPGLASSSAGLITMMSRAFNANQEKMYGLLQDLGLIDENGTPDPTKFINVEYIDRVPEDISPETGMGRANAIYYSFDSITFLNISQFYEVVTKVTRKDPVTGKSLRAPNGKVLRDIQQTRPGLERPMVTSLDKDGNKVEKQTDDTSTSIDFDRSALDELADLVAPYAPRSKSGEQFDVLGPGDLGLNIDHDAEEGEDIGAATEKAIEQLQRNIESTLNSELTFRLSDETAVTKPLEEWLQMAINFPYKPDITLVDGSKKNPFHGVLHNQLVDLQTPLNELVPLDGDLQCAFDGTLTDCEKAIYGAIFNEAARRLGNTVKQSLQAKTDKFGSAVDNEGVVINAGLPFGDKVTGNTFKLTGEFIVDKDQGVYAMREEVEDEDEDPVTDQDFEYEPKQGKTIAVVPGAFKPPHRGHLDMVQKYSNIADEVKVLISRPTKAGRKLPNGREITAEDSLKIWKLLAVELPNVDISISTHASPINAAYEYVGKDGPLNVGDKVILGCSDKDCDWKRWTGAEKYIKDGVELLTPKGTAVTPMQRQGDVPFSATDFRNALGNPNNKDEIAEFVGKENVDNVLKILGLSSELDEMAFAGAAGGYGASFPGKVRRRKTKKQQENIDTSLIDDVMRLIMERGIMR